MRHDNSIKFVTTPTVELVSDEPLTTLQLSIISDEIVQYFGKYRPEFAAIITLHRAAGCRVRELFQPDRWKMVNTTTVQIQPQKGNAVRIVPLRDLGFSTPADFARVLTDMSRLPSRQYERAFSEIVKQKHIWRLYEEGFAHPSTHMLRHVKIKELAASGYDKPYIATWIGEKSQDNLDYYLDSRFYQ